MRINRFLMPAAAIVTLLGAVLVARVAGAWQTSGRDMIDPTVPLTSADIRGWMPLEYLIERLDLSQDELYTMLGLPAQTPPGTPLKDLEDVIEVGEVREIVAAHLGEARVEHETEQKPEPQATPTLVPQPQATETPAVEPTPGSEGVHVPGAGGGAGSGPTPLPAGEVLPAAQIRGRMTLQEISDQCDVPLEALYRELHLPEETSAHTALKDLKAQISGLEVQPVRDVVAALQAR
jgi:hypothetical protein